jgi:hypothetical protein
MTTQTKNFSLQGYFMIGALLGDGSIGKLRWLGDTTDANLTLTTESETTKESYTGLRLQTGEIVTSRSGSLEYSLKNFSQANLALAFEAGVQSIVAGTVTGETFPTSLVAGDMVRLDHAFTTGLVITDSATPTAATVTNTKYRPFGHSNGVIELLDVTGYTQPFKAAYSYDAVDNLVLFSNPGVEVYLLFDGINTATNEPLLLDLWKVKHQPVSQLGLLNNGFGTLPLKASVNFDTTRSLDAALGGFGRMQQKTAA